MGPSTRLLRSIAGRVWSAIARCPLPEHPPIFNLCGCTRSSRLFRPRWPAARRQWWRSRFRREFDTYAIDESVGDFTIAASSSMSAHRFLQHVGNRHRAAEVCKFGRPRQRQGRRL
jgi:hypothetical protein